MAVRRLVLASASPSRLRLLRNSGIEPQVDPSDVDEESIAAAMAGAPCDELAVALARAKTMAVVPRCDADTVVLGADSIFEWAGRALGKPGTAQNARSRLRDMRGTSGVLHTGHCVHDVRSGETAAAAAATTVTFSMMSDAEVDAYVASGEPLHVAGSFTLDGLSAPFVESVVGDPSNVIGLSLPLVRTLLAGIGVPWLDLVDY